MKKLTILVPVKNGRNYIERKMENLITICESNRESVEVLISVNHSDDGSYEKIERRAGNHPQIRIYRHENELTMLENFRFLLGQATTPLICFSAVDDFINSTFIDEAQELFIHEKQLIGVKAKAIYSPPIHGDYVISFELKGDQHERCQTFIKYSRVSHAVNYSVYVKDHVIDFMEKFKEPIIGYDWVWGIWMAMKGEIAETRSGTIEFSVNGISRNPKVFSLLATGKLDEFLPYRKMAKSILSISQNQPTTTKLILIKFSIKLVFSNVKRLLYKLILK